jgi:hypothetical protein
MDLDLFGANENSSHSIEHPIEIVEDLAAHVKVRAMWPLTAAAYSLSAPGVLPVLELTKWTSLHAMQVTAS